MAYRKVDERLWGSFTFRALSEDGRALYQYLLTTPQNNPLCCYLMPVEYASYHLQWTPQRVQKAMAELVKARRPDGSPMVIRDEVTTLTMVYGQLEKEVIINGNVAKACEKVLRELPTASPIYVEVIRACESLNKSFLKSLIKSLRERLPKRLPERLPELQDTGNRISYLPHYVRKILFAPRRKTARSRSLFCSRCLWPRGMGNMKSPRHSSANSSMPFRALMF